MSVDANVITSIAPSTVTPKPANATQSQLQQFNDTSQNKTVTKKTKTEKIEKADTNVSGVDEEVNVDTSTPDITPAMKSVGEFLNGVSVQKGLGIAIAILIALIWLIVPTASGDTRAKLLWLTITGQTKIADSHRQPIVDSTTNTNTTSIPLTPLATGQGPSQDQLVSQFQQSQSMPIVDFSSLNMFGID